LRDAGMEVIYTGLRQTPEQVVSAVLQEDANVLGLSILSGAHDFLFPKIMELLKAEGMDNVLVLAGGIFPPEDLPKLNEIGINGVFGPGANTDDIVAFIKENVNKGIWNLLRYRL
jgi:methylmalonyl-CoA mutase C-terminal domain/subunit